MLAEPAEPAVPIELTEPVETVRESRLSSENYRLLPQPLHEADIHREQQDQYVFTLNFFHLAAASGGNNFAEAPHDYFLMPEHSKSSVHCRYWAAHGPIQKIRAAV